MLDLNDHHYFVHAVDHGGFAAASRALGLPKSTISRRVIELESRLGVRLIERTSRSFAMTDVGRAFYRHAKAMLIEAEAAEDVVTSILAEPSGTVRMTCSFGMARFVSGLISKFLAEFPKVSLIQYTTNKTVDLIEEGFDIGLRGHSAPLPDSSLVQRQLAESPWQVFAAPAYLAARGTPSQPADITRLETLALGSGLDNPSWQFMRDDQTVVVPIRPRFQSSDMESLKDAAIAGHGIVSLPAYVVRESVMNGALQGVLSDWITQRARISLLIPPRRSQLPSVRALIDFLAAEYPKLLARAPI
ncbi:MAG: LysR substrate-binding domain-containing protein [Pseudomonadaceae bacterium]|nr:LysR substrate-binding domain-containing protein [Pseudomonadaceae bacterium]